MRLIVAVAIFVRGEKRESISFAFSSVRCERMRNTDAMRKELSEFTLIERRIALFPKFSYQT